ncbi:3-methyl-2-oxobutanoate hydroxymethyltransferase [Thioalkalicoccus limnaeus]|uniref:3-methyl-2-oxobutanoate hydroxymethyltransferase n=1 Tax=Thioalkalicoccus limnaeus TaxID=120681 RepID=A0ABV4BGQ0_9GAMM
MALAPISITTLAAMKARREPIVCLTCYDAAFARLLERAGVEVLLVGDSLGMVLQGHDTTLPVTVEQLAYHSACVARGRRRALLIADMPFLSYATPERALAAAGQLMQQGGAQMVKLEGGAAVLETVRRLVSQGVPVCGHLGLLPQSIHRLGGYRYQGRDHTSADAIRHDALALQEAGAGLLVLECVPAALAQEISLMLEIPVIGIGAGVETDGQVLVLYDMLGLNPGTPPRFSRDFLVGQDGVPAALAAYVQAVKTRAFPAAEQTQW